MTLRNERVWGGITENVTSNGVAGTQNLGDTSVYLAAGYVTLKEMFGQPFTLKAGTMGFKLGSGLLVGDADTNRISSGPFTQALADLSPRKAFTGFVGILDLKPIVITGGALKVSEGAATPALSTNSDDVNAYVVNVGYDLNEVGLKGLGEMYWVERHADRTPIDNFGARVQASPIENFNVGAEVAYQNSKIRIGTAGADGTREKGDSNLAVLVNAGFQMPDVVMAPSIGVDYTELSKNWHPMMEDMTPADIANLLFPNTNVRCLGVTIGAKPMADVGASLRYTNFRSDKPLAAGVTFANDIDSYTMTGDASLGAELDVHLTYDYTEDVQFGLMGGIFMPGKAFDECNREDATQVIGSMKVTF